MNRLTKGLLLLAALSGAALSAGCLPGKPPSTADLAEQVHRDMRTIYDGAQAYKAKHGSMPPGNFWQVRSALVLAGFIREFPTPPAAIFTEETIDYRIDNYYDKMGGGQDNDAAIVVWGLRDAVCEAYNERYADPALGPGIYDWEERDKQYPGTTIGTDIQTYAIKWQSDAVDDCEIEWVVEYR